MGLDTVKLVMAFEDEFEIAIPNDVAARLQTVGDVTEYVWRRLAAEGRPRERDAVLAMVCIITCDECGTRLDELTEATTFVEDLHMD